MKAYLFCLLSLILLLSNTKSYSQVNPSTVNANVLLKPEEEDLHVFTKWLRWNNPGSMLIHNLTSQANELYSMRDKEIAGLKTMGDWQARQQRVRNKLNEMFGTFPEKTPLNAKVTGVIKMKGVRVEKIVFESFPGVYVTGCLYIPERIKGKVPAILNVIGHNQNAFRDELYQVINYNLAKKGIIVFAIDPPGQGEHVQYFDPEVNYSSIGYSVIEHCYFGYQPLLCGIPVAKYFIWEGMRAVDYLVSRKEVDANRLGISGFSGGGTITSYIAAFDDRLKVSVPCSWSTTNRRQLETKGIQEGESVLVHSVAKGITLEDFIEVRAPKPTLMTFTTRDEYLTIQGAREAYAEANNAYKAYGMESNLQWVEDDSKHWMTPKIRLTIYSFLMKHFNVQGDPSEEQAEILTEQELTVTPTGQIATSFGGKIIFDVNQKEAEKLVNKLETSRKNIKQHIDSVKVKARKLSGFVEPSSVSNAQLNGRYQREGYTVGKYAIPGEGNSAIPFLLFAPDSVKEMKYPAIIYLHSAGKSTDAKPGGEIEKLVRKGYVVAATDVSGIGETLNTIANRQGTADAGNTAVLIGRSVAGVQAGDIIRVVNYLKLRNDVDSSNITAIGINELGIPLLHAAVFDESINNIILAGLPVSYRSIVMNKFYRVGLTESGRGTGMPFFIDYNTVIAGVLTAYDLPDLIGSIAPRKVTLAGLKDQMLNAANKKLLDEELTFPFAVYASRNASSNIRLVSSYESVSSLVD